MAEAEAWVMIPKNKNKGTEIVLDMRPLVLCKDCKYFDKSYSYDASKGYCSISEIRHDDNWFCADGECK